MVYHLHQQTWWSLHTYLQQLEQDNLVKVSKVTREENLQVSIIQGKASPSFEKDMKMCTWQDPITTLLQVKFNLLHDSGTQRANN